jgi:hypothetical protein
MPVALKRPEYKMFQIENVPAICKHPKSQNVTS